MFATIRVNEPLERIAEDWDFFAERIVPRFSTFKPVGQNIYGIRRRQIAGGGVVDLKKGKFGRLLELGPRGVVERQLTPFALSMTTAGTPHHVMHNFGYWHINDMDEVYLPMPAEDPEALGYFLVIMGMPRGPECDRFAWYCEQCQLLLHECVYPTGTAGFEGFWKAERAAVDSYNRNPAVRRCPECGWQNPPAYCWQYNKDSELEHAGREHW